MTDFAEALKSGQCFLFDGSTPTVLYERGVYINRSFDEANVVSPELVKAIHEDFRSGGAQVISTNTWAANRIKLQGYGLSESLEEINRKGALLAREVLQDGAPGWVAGTGSPTVGHGNPIWYSTSSATAPAASRKTTRSPSLLSPPVQGPQMTFSGITTRPTFHLAFMPAGLWATMIYLPAASFVPAGKV